MCWLESYFDSTGRLVATLTIEFGVSENCALSAWPMQQVASPPLNRRWERSTVSLAGPAEKLPVLMRTRGDRAALVAVDGRIGQRDDLRLGGVAGRRRGREEGAGAAEREDARVVRRVAAGSGRVGAARLEVRAKGGGASAGGEGKQRRHQSPQCSQSPSLEPSSAISAGARYGFSKRYGPRP